MTLFAAVAVALLVSGHRGARSFKLTDGTTLTLYKVALGTNSHVVYGTGWRDRLSGIIPVRYATNLGFKVASLTGTAIDSNGLVIWFKRSGSISVPAPTLSVTNSTAPGSSAASAALRPQTAMRVKVVDENGVEFSGAVRVWETNLISCALPNYPRRSTSIRLKFEPLSNSSGDNSSSLLGQIDVPNPEPSQAPRLVPEPLPARRETNGLTISLTRLVTGVSFAEASRLGYPALNSHLSSSAVSLKSYSMAWLDLLEDGQPTTNWMISGIDATTASGATGSLSGLPSMISSSRTDGIYSFEAALWPEEPAWNLAVQAVRKSDFPADELWVIHGVKIPATNESITLNASTNCDGTALSITTLTRGAARTPPLLSSPSSVSVRLAAMSTAAPNQLVLSATTSFYPGDCRLVLVRISNDHGYHEEYNRTPNSFSWQNQTRFGGPGKLQYTVKYDGLDNASSLD
ncbi:MAG TPA: hypothetical protein VFC07_13240, partial [Verrucomicrobiae bacterium]|nr:hypothetical protein [Verrucomicrobiae bacterium]